MSHVQDLLFEPPPECARCGGLKKVQTSAYSVWLPCPDCAVDQPSSGYSSPAPSGPAGDRTIQARFLRFHADNPQVYRELCNRARALHERGWNGIGIALLWESMRYDSMLKTDPSEDTWKLSNDYRSRYARLIMEQESDLEGFFTTRGLREGE